jgi:hypothetical protein
MTLFKANWRNPSEYPPPGCEDRAWLAWEFIRRHPDYAEHARQMLRLVEAGMYDRRARRKSPDSLDGVECWPSANKGETARDYFARMKQEGTIRARVDKPCNTFANRWFMNVPISPETPFSSGEISFTPFEVKGKRHQTLATRSFSLFIYPNEIAMRFRLDLSWDRQVELAKQRFNEQAQVYAKLHAQAPNGVKRQIGPGGNPRIKGIEQAHFWLRCYDARMGRTLAAANTKPDPARRRAHLDGPADQCKFFNAELKKTTTAKRLTKSDMESFMESAYSYIHDRKFLLLLLDAKSPETPSKSSRDILRSAHAPFRPA